LFSHQLVSDIDRFALASNGKTQVTFGSLSVMRNGTQCIDEPVPEPEDDEKGRIGETRVTLGSVARMQLSAICTDLDAPEPIPEPTPEPENDEIGRIGKTSVTFECLGRMQIATICIDAPDPSGPEPRPGPQEDEGKAK
jgi:hypothetical protein